MGSLWSLTSLHLNLSLTGALLFYLFMSVSVCLLEHCCLEIMRFFDWSDDGKIFLSRVCVSLKKPVKTFTSENQIFYKFLIWLYVVKFIFDLNGLMINGYIQRTIIRAICFLYCSLYSCMYRSFSLSADFFVFLQY